MQRELFGALEDKEIKGDGHERGKASFIVFHYVFIKKREQRNKMLPHNHHL